MSQADNPYASFGMVAAQAPAAERSEFIRRTYIHLAMAIYAFAAIEFAFFTLLPVDQLMGQLLSFKYSWLVAMGLFMAVSWLADSWARSSTSKGMQYAGLMLYTLAQAVICLPILYVAQQVGGMSLIATAGLITLIMFGGLTAAVFVTGKDFSFLRTALMIGGFAAMGLIVCGVIFGFDLGMAFTVAIIALACGYILYDTSNILYHYRTDQHVAAALALFASVALLFVYVLRLLIALQSRD